ncbi:hypothetical protein LWI29_023644 [Acer saccharum]|uniref:Disease resistance protein RPM1-like n=1 Tax=Acer saccharum TaxID=4024 RepID=A0AA39SCJ6_ACESA|nr:hypothetical protein LWI29_023644 [Acer saccharum]
MAEFAVTSVLEKLTPFFENELQLLNGSREEVVYAKGELERMKVFLRIADTLEDTDEEVKVWVKQIREVAHDIEDVVDEFTLLLAHNHGDGFYGFLHKFSCCIKNIKCRYRIAHQIQGINTRINNICQGHQRLLQKFRLPEQGNTWNDRRGDALLLDKSDLVGIDEPRKKLVGWLVEGVSRSFKMEEILKDMVQQLFRAIRKPAPKGLDGMTISRLKTMIKNFLQERRYLIVLDDVWNINEWDAIKYALPTNDYGSRVMLTTRNADLAFSSGIESEGRVYNLEPLKQEESWTLFCRKTFYENSCPPHLEEICRYILKKCEGLPLAIVAIGGVLATKDKRRIDEWEMVWRSFGAEIEGNDKLMNLRKVLSLSFNDLPYYLKSCFLYLSIFPEDHLIEHMRLIRLWTAEGFVEAKEGKTLEEVAEDYFNELLNRSLMQVVGTTSYGRVKTCRIHDLLREIIISKSREQNFAAIAKEQNAMWPDKVRRLSIHNTLQNVQQNRPFSQLRSLFMFGVVERPYLHTKFPNGFRLLGVLDLRGAPLAQFPIEVVNLFYLKYLSLRNTKVRTIPSFIGKLQNLETLDLKHADVTVLPAEILKLKRLRHLLVYRYGIESYAHFHSKYGFKGLEKIGALQSLQKLSLVDADQQSSGIIMHELGKLTQLTRLGIINLKTQDGEKLCTSIQNLTNLRALSIMSIEEGEIIDLHHLIRPPQFLQRIYFTGRLQTAGGFKKLKHLGLDKFDELRCIQIEIGAVQSVEKLSIQRCKLLEKVPLGIEHLSKLKLLEFFDMPHEFLKTLRPDAQGEDYWRVKHIPEVYSTYWRDGGWEVYPLESFSEGESSPCPNNTVISSQELQTRWK